MSDEQKENIIDENNKSNDNQKKIGEYTKKENKNFLIKNNIFDVNK